jgi:hypothetical protein
MNPPDSGNLVTQSFRSLKKLCALMTLLLIANSSQALEIITHDSHAHESAVTMELNDHTPAPDNHHPGAHYADNSEAQDEECICDEICCVSSVGFGSVVAAGLSPETDSFNEKLFNHYQSVSLDQFLPPPTR